LDWIQAIKTDDDKALKKLYAQSREPCRSWLIKNYKISAEDATEIFQISVVILYENICSGKLQKLNSNINTYLHAIAKNKVMELRRRYYFGKRSMTQITNEMGYKNTDTTKNQKYKCLKRLQSMAMNHKEKIR
jgi:spore coat polysaccharide biosynthesis predicted glycosyltransferase SpsG